MCVGGTKPVIEFITCKDQVYSYMITGLWLVVKELDQVDNIL